MKHFREQTMGKKVIVGRTTFEDTGPLKGREWYVITTRPVEGAVAITLDEAKEMKDSVVIGGQSIYEQMLPFADMIMLSVIRGVYPVDTWFPSLDDWEINWEEDRGEYKLFEYVRKELP